MEELRRERLSTIDVILLEYPLLARHEPENPILRFICDVTPHGFSLSSDEESRREFSRRYGAISSPDALGMAFSRYLADLTKALEQYKSSKDEVKPQRPSIRHELEPFKYDPDSFGW